MIINSITGLVTRALPVSDGLEIKISSNEDTRTLSVPASQTDIIHALRSARMSAAQITVRFSANDVVIGTEIVGAESTGLARAA